MGFVMPEIVAQKIIQQGIRDLRANQLAFNDLFEQFVQDELNTDYGQTYLDQVWSWFTTTKIPVVQAWTLNAQQVPCFSVHLSTENEDENKAALDDIGFVDETNQEFKTGVFTVSIDIGIHASKAGDHVMWMYYILSYILFNSKLSAHRLGLKLTTFSASDYRKEGDYMGNNIWTRWIRLKGTTENWLANSEATFTVSDVNVDPATGLAAASSVATSLDVDPTTVNTTQNLGLKGSHDPLDIDDVGLA